MVADVMSTAIENNGIDVVKYLISTGYEVSKITGSHLYKAASQYTPELFLYLIEVGVDIELENGCALRSASEFGHLAAVKRPVKAGAKINLNDDDDSALVWAANYGHIKIVKFLVKAGANIHVYNGSPFRRACACNRLDVAEYLLSAGAQLDIYGNAALDMSVRHPSAVRFLVVNGVNPFANNNSALRLARQHNLRPATEYLIVYARIVAANLPDGGQEYQN